MIGLLYTSQGPHNKVIGPQDGMGLLDASVITLDLQILMNPQGRQKGLPYLCQRGILSQYWLWWQRPLENLLEHHWYGPLMLLIW